MDVFNEQLDEITLDIEYPSGWLVMLDDERCLELNSQSDNEDDYEAF